MRAKRRSPLLLISMCRVGTASVDSRTDIVAAHLPVRDIVVYNSRTVLYEVLQSRQHIHIDTAPWLARFDTRQSVRRADVIIHAECRARRIEPVRVAGAEIVG